MPSVDGARTPQNRRPMPPCRNRSMSAIESAPATMPATSAATFAPAAQPAPPGTVSCARASSASPARCASATVATSPAADTRLGSSKRANRTGPT